jgi:hypothetical protein
MVNPTYDQVYNWAKAKHNPFVQALPNYPGTLIFHQKINNISSPLFNIKIGRAVFGSIIPGFDDYTEGWGACQVQIMPRNTLLISAATDYLKDANITHTLATTWDDWTEVRNLRLCYIILFLFIFIFFPPSLKFDIIACSDIAYPSLFLAFSFSVFYYYLFLIQLLIFYNRVRISSQT